MHPLIAEIGIGPIPKFLSNSNLRRRTSSKNLLVHTCQIAKLLLTKPANDQNYMNKFYTSTSLLKEAVHA